MPRHHELTAEEFAAAIAATPRPFVLDVRSVEEFQAGHVPGSASIPVHDIAQRRSELPTSKIRRILVVGEGAKRTTAAAAWLVLMGAADVGVLSGGYAAWKGPVEKGPPTPPKPKGPELRVI